MDLPLPSAPCNKGSEVNGQELVNEAVNMCKEVLTALRNEGVPQGDHLVEDLEKSFKELEALKKRPTLRTKNGTNQAFPVKEAAENLREAWEDAPDDPEEFKAMAAEFVDAVGTLKESLKGRTVVMT